MIYDWARVHPDGYECSIAGDYRFSPLVAKLADGRLILDALSEAKDNKHLNNWQSYLSVWGQWARENPALMSELAQRARYGILTDRFATTGFSQARALAHWLTELHAPSESEPVPDASTPPAPRGCVAITPLELWLALARGTRLPVFCATSGADVWLWVES
jgi:hypothetical protein